MRQKSDYKKIAVNNCSDFEGTFEGGYENYFIYRPQNTKDKIVFVRHVAGVDGSPFDNATIKLFPNLSK